MRKRRWPVMLGSLVGLFLLLFLLNYWLNSLRHSLAIGMGKENGRLEFVPVNWPIDIDVVCNVTSTLKGSNCVACDYDSEITFRNNFSKEVKLHFPLLRKAHCSPNSTQFIYAADLEPEFKQNNTITLKPGESFNISFAKKACDFLDRDFFDGKESFDFGRWALVFGVPEGDNPDEYLVGTVLTNPIHWKIDKNCKFLGNK